MVSYNGHGWYCTTANSDGSWTAGNWSDLGVCSSPTLAVGTVYTFYVRAIGSDRLDPNQDSNESVVVTPHNHEQLCSTYNGTFSGSALTMSTLTGGNAPFYMRQTAQD